MNITILLLLVKNATARNITKQKPNLRLRKVWCKVALQKTFQTKMGVSGNYIRVQPTFRDKTTVLLRMEYWKDAATRAVAGATPMNDQMTGSGDSRIIGFKCLYQFTYDLASTDNIYIQAYSYLKKLPEFAESVDC